MAARFGANPIQAFQLALTCVLALAVALFMAESIHWPVVGDASLMHYVVFLIDRGAAPYRDIAEMNMPGAYLAEWFAVHAFGGGDLAFRLFDLSLGLAAAAAMAAIALPPSLPEDWFAGVWAGALFLLIHGRDGIPQAGERDLTLAACLLVGYAFLFLALRRDRPTIVSGIAPLLALLFGLLAGFAAAIKPTMLPLGPIALLLAAWQLRRERRPSRRLILCGSAGLLLCWGAIAYFLWREGALPAFSTTIREMAAYHAQLGRRRLGYLLLHSFSPLMPLLVGWLALLAVRTRRPAAHPNWERLQLLAALALGLASYVFQGKGFPYQRYPFLACLLLVMAIDFAQALRAKGAARLVAILALAYGVFGLAAVDAVRAGEVDPTDLGTVGLLQKDLQALPPPELAGGVQCVDSVTACVDVLYRMKLVEASYVFYDEFLFGPASVPAIRDNRAKFWSDLQRNPPAVIVVTAPLFPDGPDNYAKLALWPEFDDYLRRRYRVAVRRAPTAPVHWWSWWRHEKIQDGYRIYLRQP